jgi:probable F420-dependent oxidoreductase
MVVALGKAGNVVYELDGRVEVVELEHLLDFVALPLPVSELVQALLNLLVVKQNGHYFLLAATSSLYRRKIPCPRYFANREVCCAAGTARRGATRPDGALASMDYAIGIGGPLPLIGPMAKMVEDAGFESCWAAETTNTSFITAAVAVQATEKINVGTAIALAFPRSPTITAMTAWDLDELSGGRFILGLGSQVKRVNENRFSVPFEHPAPKLKEYAEVLRTVWAANRGEDVIHEGRFYNVTMPTFHGQPQPNRRDVPIYFAAVGKVMARVCGEIADGLIGHPLASSRYLEEVVRPAIAEGANRAGRKPEECNLTASPMIAISDDVDLARREVKLQIAFYATTRTYRAILELHGREQLIGDLRSAFEARDKERMVELIDDELCDAIAVAGPASEVLDRVEAWHGVADRLMVSGPWYGPSPQRMLENYQALVETFGSAK